MSKNIHIMLWVIVVVTVVATQVMVAEVSPQHAEALKTMLWDLPCMVIERLIPGFGS